MRLFIALDLPEAVLAAWRPGLPDARWTPAERMHLTLRFLGPRPEAAGTATTVSLVHSERNAEGSLYTPLLTVDQG